MNRNPSQQDNIIIPYLLNFVKCFTKKQYAENRNPAYCFQ